MRAALRRAALAAVVDQGWQAASSRSITSRAGAPLGSLNYHFDSREAMLRDVAMAEVLAMFATPWEVIENSAGVDELVDGMIGWSRSPDVTPEQQVLLLEVMAQSRRDTELSSSLQAGLGGYREQLAVAFARLGVRSAPGVERTARDLLPLASAFAAHCNGLWLQYVIEPQFPHDAAAAESALVWKAALGQFGPTTS